MCQCLPDPLEPPNPKIKQCRRLLQALCFSLLILGGLAIAVGDFYGIINYLIYAYLLYMGWATFNWCILLITFLFLFVQAMGVVITFAGMIEYKLMFIHNQIMNSVYVIVEIVFFPTAIIITHYAYRHFKNLGGMALGGGFMQQPNQPNDAQRQQQQQQEHEGQYYRMRDDRGPPTGNSNNRNNNTPAPPENNVFRGQGVRIG